MTDSFWLGGVIHWMVIVVEGIFFARLNRWCLWLIFCLARKSKENKAWVRQKRSRDFGIDSGLWNVTFYHIERRSEKVNKRLVRKSWAVLLPNSGIWAK